MEVKTFVSIDFETIHSVAIDGNEYSHLPVSVGIVKVMDGIVVQKFHSFIKPPVEGEWVGIKSGISSKDCLHAPSYEELFPILDKLIGCYQLVAYGHGTENSVLNGMEDYYHIEHSCLLKNQMMGFSKKQFIDPLEILKARGEKDNSLGKACERYGIKLNNAHDALCDAEATALLLLKLQDISVETRPQSQAVNRMTDCKKKDKYPFDKEVPHVLLEIQETDVELRKSYKMINNPVDYIGKKKKDNSFFNKELPVEEVINTKTPFFRKRVCCTGFPTDVVDSVNWKMYRLGAIVKGGITETQTDMLILGPESHRSTSKISKAEKWGKEIISFEDFKTMLSECGELDDLNGVLH